jgi:hypothetical protein
VGLGIHVNMPPTARADVAKAVSDFESAPDGLSDAEKAAFEQLDGLNKKGAGYFAIMATRPQTIG